MEPDNSTQLIPPITQQTPTQILAPEKRGSPTILWLLILVLIGVASYVGYQNWQLKQQVSRNKPTPTSSIIPTTILDPTVSWKTYTDSVLTITYKLPDTFGLMDLSGKEISGETGTQYCLQYLRSQSFRILPPVFAGSGPCAGGDLVIGTTSKNYSAGREGGFGDLQGYIKQGQKYVARFVNGRSFELPSNLVIETTNSNGVTYIKIIGANSMQDRGGEQMSIPILGTPGEGNLGALFNISNSKYAGFNVQMSIKPGQDETLFDQILSTFKFINHTVTTDDWKTYTNKILNYTIKYPSDWTINTSQAELPISTENSQELSISKGSYKLTILWPSAYGPGICFFDDQSRSEAPEMASYCEGKYIEFSSDRGKELHRRLVKPESFGEHQQWEVYTKEQSYFVTVPVIRLTAPLNYQADQIETMDQILSTYTSTN